MSCPKDSPALWIKVPSLFGVESIRGVEARSWPLWSGVELEIGGADGEGFDGPLVIRANDAEEAERLSDAIDRARRSRLPVSDVDASGEAAQPAD